MNTDTSYDHVAKPSQTGAKKTKPSAPKRHPMVGRFIDGVGYDGGLFNFGFTMISFRCHVWGIVDTVQARMRSQWHLFSNTMSSSGARSVAQMTPEVIRKTLKTIESGMDWNKESISIGKMNELVLTVNNIFGALPGLKWAPIEYLGKGNIRHEWKQAPALTSNDFQIAMRAPNLSWVGKGMFIQNSGAASSLVNLGKDAISHCYRVEFAPRWLKVYRNGWRAFMRWCPFESTDELTQEHIEAFAAWLVEQTQQAQEPVPVDVAIAAMHMVNDVLGRLRGSEWESVAIPFPEEDINSLPHPIQIPISSIKDRFFASEKPVFKQLHKLDAPENSEEVSKNYFLATSLRMAGQRVIKLRAEHLNTGYQFSKHRSHSWLVFTNFLEAKKVHHLCQLNSDLLSDFADSTYKEAERKGISDAEAYIRIAHVLGILGSIKSLEFVPQEVFDNGYCVKAWSAPTPPSPDSVARTFAEIEPDELLRLRTLNKGLGTGVMSPLETLVTNNQTSRADQDFIHSCSLSFSISMRDLGIHQLEDVQEAHVDAFLDELEDRVEAGDTTMRYARQLVSMINTAMPTFHEHWVPRRLEVRAPTQDIDPTRTAVDALQPIHRGQGGKAKRRL